MKKLLTILVIILCIIPRNNAQTYCDTFPLPPIEFQFDYGCGDTSGVLCASIPGFTDLDSLFWSWPGHGLGQCITALVDSQKYIVRVSEPIHGCSAVATYTTPAYKPPIVLSATIVQPRCGNYAQDSIIVSHIGGTGVITYNLFPTLQQLSSNDSLVVFDSINVGAYKVIATDAVGCTTSLNVKIDTSTAPKLALVTKVDARCNDPIGFAIVSPTGVSPPFEINWSNGDRGVVADSLGAGIYTATLVDSVGCSDTLSVTVTDTDPPVVIVPNDSTSCDTNNGVLFPIATPSGDYEIFWKFPLSSSDSLQNDLAPGTYTVIVTDPVSGCSVTATGMVDSSTALVVTLIPTPTSCGLPKGTITGSVVSGTAPFGYSVPGIGLGNFHDSLSAGVYTLRVSDAAGCSASATATVGTSSGITLNVSLLNHATCGNNNGSAVVTASGGSGPITITWSNGVTGNSATSLTPGNYTVTATDSLGCADTLVIVINATNPSHTVSIPTDSTSCSLNNGTLTPIVNPVGIYDYSWMFPLVGTDSIQTDLSAGTYTVIVTNPVTGCSTTTTGTVLSSLPLQLSMGSTPDSCQLGIGIASAIVNGTAPYQYDWSGSGDMTSVRSGLGYGTYTVSVIDALGCAASQSVLVDSIPCMIAPPQGDRDSMYVEFCWGESVIVNGESYDSTGRYIQFTPDGFVTDTLDIFAIELPKVDTLVRATTTDCGFVPFDDFVQDSISLNQLGCPDTVYMHRAIVYPTYSFQETVPECEGTIVIWRGIPIDSSGMFTKTYLTINGCDSTYTATAIFAAQVTIPRVLSKCSLPLPTSLSIPGPSCTDTLVSYVYEPLYSTKITVSCAPDTIAIDTVYGICDTIVTNINVHAEPGSITLYDTVCTTPVPSPQFFPGAGCNPDTTVISLWLGIQSEVSVTKFVCPSDTLVGQIRIDTVSLSTGCLQRVITNYVPLIPSDTIEYVDTCKILLPLVTQLLSIGGCDSLKITTVFNNTGSVLQTVPLISCSIPVSPIAHDTLSGTCDTIRTLITTWVPKDSSRIMSTCSLVEAAQLPTLDTIQVGACDWRLITGWALIPMVDADSVITKCSGIASDSIVTYVDSSGCVHKQRRVVNIIAIPINNLSDTYLCPGETTTIGTTEFGPYSPNTVTPISVTFVSVGGCDSVVVQTVITWNNPPLTLSATRITCRDSLAELHAYTTAAEIVWSNGQMGSPISVVAGDYGVVVTDTIGCQATDSISVAGYDPLRIDTIFMKPASCLDGVVPTGSLTAVISGGVAPLSLLWSTGDTTLMIDSLLASNYQLLVTDSLGCFTSRAKSVKEQGCNIWTDPLVNSLVWVHIGLCLDYPNPVTGDMGNFPVLIEFKTLAGSTLLSFKDQATMGELLWPYDISSLDAGIYLVAVTSPNGEVGYGEFVLRIN